MNLPLPELPDDLDQYLRNHEAHHKDITPNTEKCIFWAGKTGEQTRYAVVYLHGFSATRQEIRPLSDLVAAHFNANLYYPRLTGHGRPGDAMLEADIDQWHQDALEAWAVARRLGKQVIVIGNSTGSTLATWLAAHVPAHELAALILLSPNFSPRDPKARMLTWPIGGWLAELIIGKHRSWEPDNRAHARYWSHKYPSRALIPMMQLVVEVEKLDKSKITAPTLMIHSPRDQVISTSAVEKAFHAFGSIHKQLVPFVDAEDPRQHILAGDILSPKATRPLVDIICRFIEDSL